jgi:hypothetical protein
VKGRTKWGKSSCSLASRELVHVGRMSGRIFLTLGVGWKVSVVSSELKAVLEDQSDFRA